MSDYLQNTADVAMRLLINQLRKQNIVVSDTIQLNCPESFHPVMKKIILENCNEAEDYLENFSTKYLVHVVNQIIDDIKWFHGSSPVYFRTLQGPSRDYMNKNICCVDRTGLMYVEMKYNSPGTSYRFPDKTTIEFHVITSMGATK